MQISILHANVRFYWTPTRNTAWGRRVRAIVKNKTNSLGASLSTHWNKVNLIALYTRSHTKNTHPIIYTDIKTDTLWLLVIDIYVHKSISKPHCHSHMHKLRHAHTTQTHTQIPVYRTHYKCHSKNCKCNKILMIHFFCKIFAKAKQNRKWRHMR